MLFSPLARRYRPPIGGRADAAQRFAGLPGSSRTRRRQPRLPGGTAHGWDSRSFRVYYLAGGLLTAPLLGAGSLLLTGATLGDAPIASCTRGSRRASCIAMPVHGAFHSGVVPTADDHLDWLPKVIAIAGNSLGTLAVVAVALLTIRRRPPRQRPPPRGRRRRRCRDRARGHAVCRRCGICGCGCRAVLLYLGGTRET